MSAASKVELSAAYQPRTNADDVGVGDGVPVGVVVGDADPAGGVLGEGDPVGDVTGDGDLVGVGEPVGDVVGDGVCAGARINDLVGTGDEVSVTEGDELGKAEVVVAVGVIVGDPWKVLASAFPPRMTETTARTALVLTTIHFSTLMGSLIPANDSP